MNGVSETEKNRFNYNFEIIQSGGIYQIMFNFIDVEHVDEEGNALEGEEEEISEEEFFEYIDAQFVEENYYDLVHNQDYLNSL